MKREYPTLLKTGNWPQQVEGNEGSSTRHKLWTIVKALLKQNAVVGLETSPGSSNPVPRILQL